MKLLCQHQELKILYILNQIFQFIVIIRFKNNYYIGDVYGEKIKFL